MQHLSSLEGRRVWGRQTKRESSLLSFQNIVFYCDEMPNVKWTFLPHIHIFHIVSLSAGTVQASAIHPA